MTEISPLRTLLDTLPQQGQVEWIGVRPARGEPMTTLQSVKIEVGQGLQGDRFSARTDNPRQVTLIQHEHLAVVAACLSLPKIEAAMLRRNIVVSGINLLALKDKTFRLGDAILEMTGLCHPCSKMERLLGAGGYNAMRGHGGITARVVSEGSVHIGDPLSYNSA
jgi:MOSC domain-containing protein YiiM